MRGFAQTINAVTIVILLLFIGSSLFIHSIRSKQTVHERQVSVQAALRASAVADRVRTSIKSRPILFYQPELSLRTMKAEALEGISLASHAVLDVRDTGIAIPEDLPASHYPPVKELVVTVQPEEFLNDSGFELRTVQSHP